MNPQTVTTLIQRALDARKKSYCPYSSFAVGAALLTSDGEIYTGANIECSSHTPTVCAERVAFCSAIHDGKKAFSAIAIVGGDKREDVSFFCPPCGVCRQVMSEFCQEDFTVILYDGKDHRTFTLGELLPVRFGLLDKEGDTFR